MKSKRAITPEQKREIIEQLYAIWCRVPELRLGQLVYINSTHLKKPGLFYIEDVDFIKLLDCKTLCVDLEDCELHEYRDSDRARSF